MTKRIRQPSSTGPFTRERFLELPCEPTIELRIDLSPPCPEGEVPFDFERVRGARVKPVLVAPENRATALDLPALKSRILEAGAVYCKTPVVHVIRTREAREERHAVELPLEDSLALFAAETRAPDEYVTFAAALAREADAGGRE